MLTHISEQIEVSETTRLRQEIQRLRRENQQLEPENTALCSCKASGDRTITQRKQHNQALFALRLHRGEG